MLFSFGIMSSSFALAFEVPLSAAAISTGAGTREVALGMELENIIDKLARKNHSCKELQARVEISSI